MTVMGGSNDGQLTRQTVPGEVDIEYRFSATANDGKLWQRKDWVSGEEVTYQYDQIGRLIAAATTGPEWGQSYTYDGFGNLTQQAVTKGTAPSMSMIVDQSTNRLGGTHDANGNLLLQGGTPYLRGVTYDVLNRLSSVTGNSYDTESYFYSARNERIVVKKSLWGAQTQPDEVNFYGADGVLLGVYQIETRTDSFGSSNSSPVRIDDKERVYFGARLVAIGSTTMKRVFTDRLGSVVRKDTQAYRYYPYGQEVGGATTNGTPKFGTYTRDVSGLDYAMNRFYKNEWGRFTSPDPYQVSGGVTDPGSWNRYAYVGGNPVNYNDPPGLQRWCLGDPVMVWSGCYGGDIPKDVVEAEEVSSERGGGGTVAKIDKHTNDVARGLFKKALAEMKKTRCDDVFRSLDVSLEHLEAIGNSVDFYDIRDNSFYRNVTQDYISNNKSNILLGETPPPNAYAVTLRASSSSNSILPKVLLADRWWNSGQNEFTIVHEVLHYATGMDDIPLMVVLAREGFRHLGRYLDTHQITQWLNDGCPDMRSREGRGGR